MMRPYNNPRDHRHRPENLNDCVSAGQSRMAVILLRFIGSAFVPVRVQRPFRAI